MGSGVQRIMLRLRAFDAMLLLGDALIILLGMQLAYHSRFGGPVPYVFARYSAIVTGATLVLFVAVFFVFDLYRHVWRYVGVDTYLRLAAACIGATLLLGALDMGWQLQKGERLLPAGIVVIAGTYVLLGAAALRGTVRAQAWIGGRVRARDARNVLIVGAGDAGSLLLRDVENQPELGLRVIGFLDDDPSKRGRRIRGARVLGAVTALPEIVSKHEVEEIFVALPSAKTDERRRVLAACTDVARPTRTTTSLARGADFGLSDFHRVRLEDLLGRQPVRLDLTSIASSVNAKTVLVTGAAGSIGSELCRAVLRYGPRRLIMLDIDESRLHDTWLEIKETPAGDVAVMCIADIRSRRRIEAVFRQHEVDLVIHAAAYKHVPLMELAPAEAVLTNVRGTRTVLEAAENNGVSRFVFVSTDKAVDPASVMGLTKYVGELLTLRHCSAGLNGCIVRFGNVLGSRSSVVPIFEAQLKRGGPIQVTHPEVTRYFMTIPEAASLVLQAQAFSTATDIFVLDMGEPVKIVDLAKKMISLSGLRTDIIFTGLREGEKLHEVLTRPSEAVIPSKHEKILVLSALPVLDGSLDERISEMIATAENDNVERLLSLFEEIAPGFLERNRGSKVNGSEGERHAS